jgi:hypothetical protein
MAAAAPIEGRCQCVLNAAQTGDRRANKIVKPMHEIAEGGIRTGVAHHGISFRRGSKLIQCRSREFVSDFLDGRCSETFIEGLSRRVILPRRPLHPCATMVQTSSRYKGHKLLRNAQSPKLRGNVDLLEISK